MNDNDISVLVTQALASRTIYGTNPLLSSGKGLLSQELYFPTLDEESLIQDAIKEYQKYVEQQRQEYQEYQRQQRDFRLGIKIATSIVGLVFGISHSFDDSGIDWSDGLDQSEFSKFAHDVGGGAALGLVGGRISTNIMEILDTTTLQESGLDLDKLGLGWIGKDPQSYLYSIRSHRGHAVRRVLLIVPHPETNEPCIAFAVQFPDGYVAYLTFLNQMNLFGMSGVGLQLTMDSLRQTHLGDLPVDDGRKVPVQFWEDSCQEQYTIAIPYTKPHHSIY
ncbi:hypothetical protein [Merismopedia glauca]|uniref:Uncharacterized protein n=1 Tax=Merismopedia glauca CCAP 1448/3 TaxID=1296344 RepID=A0A2T1C4S4_9CYAN|nr:hypothetical protein [Merismopedia glauca]PSB03259.1 hypothetical protein C7B64_09175 [Merismopedia glauca CCAP 1448/3]